ncbi:cyclase family protein [Actinomadura livida]|nr:MULTISPECIES: cyclase family protein [Actinomadura]MBB4775928.1 kynurenine formamidase [Actinomadura catellatispora]
MSDFHSAADRVRNWGRWGDEDEIGTLNFIDEEKMREAGALVKKGAVFSLGLDFGSGGPQGDFLFRNNPIHVMTVDGGDAEHFVQHSKDWTANPTAHQISQFFADNPFRFNDDMIIMPLQAATQWDALSHTYYDGKLYNGFPASAVTSQGATRCGIDKVIDKGIATRGVLLDVVAHRGDEVCLDPAVVITPEELDEVADRQGVAVGRGDIVVVRTGWCENWRRTGERGAMATTGLSWTCAEWLHEREVAAVAADNLTVEVQQSEIDGVFLPFHLLCERDMGMMLGEYWDVTALAADCAQDGVYEFQLIAPPLSVVGAVGSPVNPIAIK